MPVGTQRKNLRFFLFKLNVFLFINLTKAIDTDTKKIIFIIYITIKDNVYL